MNIRQLDQDILDRPTKVYVSFGQVHTHSVNGKTFDKDTIAVIRCSNYHDGRAKAFDYFNGIFHNCWSEEEWGDGSGKLEWFPKGLVPVN